MFAASSGAELDTRTFVSGWGAGLDLKSTEYKFLDDRTHTRMEDEDAPADMPDPVLPWTVQTLSQTSGDAVACAHPAAAAVAGLSNASVYGCARVYAREAKLEPWETADLGLQAAAYVMECVHSHALEQPRSEDGFEEDPLRRLVAVTGHAPALAHFLSRLPVPAGLRSEVAHNSRVVSLGGGGGMAAMAGGGGGSVGASLSVNGISVEPSSPTFNLFSLLNVLRTEAHVVAQLDTLPLSIADKRRLQAIAISGSPEARAAAAAAGSNDDTIQGGTKVSSTIRVDVLEEPDVENIRGAAPYDAFPHPIIDWLNDLEDESNPLYKRWPSHIHTLLTPSWQLHTIRKNLYNVIVAADPSSPAGLRAIAMMPQYVAMRVPIRFGGMMLPAKHESQQEFLAAAADLAAARTPAARTETIDVNDVATAASPALFPLLHAAAVLRHGRAVGVAFTNGIASAWREAAEMRQALAAASGNSAQGIAMDITLPVSSVVDAYVSAVTSSTRAWTKSAATAEAKAAIVDEGGHLRAAVGQVLQWLSRRGIAVPSMVVNGRVRPGADLQQELMSVISEELQLLQRAVGSGALDDGVAPSVYHALLGRASRLTQGSSRRKAKTGIATPASAETGGNLLLPGAGLVVPKFDAVIFAADDEQEFLPLSAPEAASMLEFLTYVHAPGTADDVKPVSLTLFDDLNRASGLHSLSSLVGFVTGTNSSLPGVSSALRSAVAKAVRVSVLHVPAEPLRADAASQGAPRSRAIGDVLALAWNLICGAAPVLLHVRSEEQGPLLAQLVQIASRFSLPAALPSSEDAAQSALAFVLSAADMLKAAGDRAAASDAVAASSEFVLRPKVAVRLTSLLKMAVALETVSNDAADYFRSFDAAHANASTLARGMLTAASAASYYVDAAADAAGVRAIAANGRVIALQPSTSTCDGVPSAGAAGTLAPCLSHIDVAAFAQQERLVRGAGVAALLGSVSYTGVDADALTADWISRVVMAGASAVGASLRVAAGNAGGRATTRQALQTDALKGAYSSFITGPARSSVDAGTAASVGLYVTAIVDPASEEAARVAPLLLMLRDRLRATVRVYLVPSTGHTDLPVKTFYRFVLPDDVKVEAGHPTLTAWQHPRAIFAALPRSAILTMKTHVPEPWNVQTASADVDLDNIKLADVAAHTSVTYEIKDVLVAGQCMDVGQMAFPNGLQLVLGPVGAPEQRVSDTLVMQNLGYWQLKAQPGTWSVTLAEGRASDLFSIVVPEEQAQAGSSSQRKSQLVFFFGGSGADVQEVRVPSLEVTIRDFTGPITQLRVRKHEGKEHISLLDSLGATDGSATGSSASSSLWGAVTSLFGGGDHSGSSGNATRPLIHVFSLASGHLYERFLRIMMLSAVRATKSSRIKFWLVENFLSPQFKANVHNLAHAYDFEVGFVTYKWPNWLRAQTEKQRIIWGYKILFLDVLFPLNVSKVIYVDSDQVVRADLGELWGMDLQGAPYAYTPFCDSRADTLGFQFWRSGYWAEHLKGRPYHISALYVVDLNAFRRAAVGDSLRAIYDTLSRDPNSLSNLDQDLPNYAQHMVPIHSLPQEWLWCESWCSDASKSAAKTIDLCNNPRWKEPKLSMARRIIAGELFERSWTQLDEEATAAMEHGRRNGSASTDGHTHTKQEL